MEPPPWLKQPCQELDLMIERRQAPQALLIHGAPGTGRRYLAGWLASRLLPVRPGSERAAVLFMAGDSTEPAIAHPDLLTVQPLPEKNTIAVEQVRELIGFLQLTSHQGGARIVVCWPADAMTRAAANSLLKTLEEPPAGSVIVLISAAPAALPATVLSRCHRLRVCLPTRQLALAWLREQADCANWGLLLDFAAGAPFGALDLMRSGFDAQARQLVDDLRNVRHKRETPIAVARRWAGVDRGILLRWLYLQAARDVSQESAMPQAVPAMDVTANRLQIPPKPLNIHPAFERLREIASLYQDRSRALNAELQLGALLQHWYGDTIGESSKG